MNTQAGIHPEMLPNVSLIWTAILCPLAEIGRMPLKQLRTAVHSSIKSTKNIQVTNLDFRPATTPVHRANQKPRWSEISRCSKQYRFQHQHLGCIGNGLEENIFIGLSNICSICSRNSKPRFRLCRIFPFNRNFQPQLGNSYISP